MIEYDYEIVRDEGDEIIKLRPDKIKKDLDNLVYIEGTNDSGKSTLLDIIALAFYGIKSKKLHPSLLNKMANLVNSKYQTLTFTVKVSNKDNSLQLISEKKDPKKPDITVYEIINGKKSVIIPERFEEKYNLIYDIPDNPKERLNQLADDVKDAQIRYGNRIGELKEFLRKTINDIKSGGDPNRLPNLIRQLKDLMRKNENLKIEINVLEKEQDALENSVYYKYYTYYNSLYHQTENAIKQLDKNFEKKVKQNRKETSEYRQLSQTLTEQIGNLRGKFDNATELVRKTIQKKDSHNVTLWEKINLYPDTSTLEFDENLEYEIVTLKNILTKSIGKKQDEKSYQEAKMYKDLIQVLENYKNLSLTLPGTKKTISDFIEDLEKSISDKNHLILEYQNTADLIKLLDEIKEQKDAIEEHCLKRMKYLRKTQEPINDDYIEEEALDKKIIRLNADSKKYVKKSTFYETSYAQKGKPPYNQICEIGKGDLKKYGAYTEDQLLEKITNLKELSGKKKTSYIKNNITIDGLTSEIEELENKKPHPYQNYISKLDELHRIINILESKMRNEFHKYILDIIKKQIDADTNITKEQIQYNNSIFKYLGKKIGFVPRGNKYYQVEIIDLINGVITTKEGKNIFLTTIGTGRSQSTYLMGKLNASDNRKIIALFDEIAMMDNKSLAPIYDKFRELYRKNQLLIGMVVQRAEEINVVSKVKE